MAIKPQVTFDCVDPDRLARFWAAVLGYELQPPPEGFADWPEALRAWGLPESEWNSASAVVDPHGICPRIFFQRVPEPKSGKNRLHLDVPVSDGPGIPLERKREQVRAGVRRVVALGASEVGDVEELGSYWTVMRDPEGNEFCVT
ncbi:MAG TPA: VOC family protein [Kineosporiaceae bacterium]|nr:VOC family protein [Kineosporiaceae bacterium]